MANFWHVTLPSLVAIFRSSFDIARAIGSLAPHYGSGNLAGRRRQRPFIYLPKFNEGQIEAANAIAIVLALFSVLIQRAVFCSRLA